MTAVYVNYVYKASLLTRRDSESTRVVAEKICERIESDLVETTTTQRLWSREGGLRERLPDKRVVMVAKDGRKKKRDLGRQGV